MPDQSADDTYREPEHPITGNQLVAYNLMRARKTWGWSQEQAAERLEPYLGVRWSKAVYSAAERSYQGSRVRQFTADELLAMSRAFAVPVSYFFLPPPEHDREGAEGVTSGGRALNWHDLLIVLFGGGQTEWIMPRLRDLPEGEVEQVVWETQGAPAHRDAILKGIDDIQARFRLDDGITSLRQSVDELKENLTREILAELDKRLPASKDGGDG